jgi:hypothetical protein
VPERARIAEREAIYAARAERFAPFGRKKAALNAKE